jgi:uncharacterized protein YkwD
MAMRKRFGHDGSNGSTSESRAETEGYSGSVAENVGPGTDAAHFVSNLLKSPDHSANIVNCDFKSIRVGVVHVNAKSNYWTQVFDTV